MNRLLNETQVSKIAGIDLPVFSHNMLRKIKDIRALFHYPAILLLYEVKHHKGHWTALIFHKHRKIIEFFDPYGLQPDEQKFFIPKNFWLNSFLRRLLFKFMLTHPDWKVEYNEVPLQEWDKNISTCGRWVGVRIFFRKLPLEKFQNYFLNIKNKDFVIYQISKNILQKNGSKSIF
ncbi:MAG: hypothetical protein QW303_01035 [Nitrososphaerota archaeon]